MPEVTARSTGGLEGRVEDPAEGDVVGWQRGLAGKMVATGKLARGLANWLSSELAT